jgi:hypothetical protein
MSWKKELKRGDRINWRKALSLKKKKSTNLCSLILVVFSLKSEGMLMWWNLCVSSQWLLIWWSLSSRTVFFVCDDSLFRNPCFSKGFFCYVTKFFQVASCNISWIFHCNSWPGLSFVITVVPFTRSSTAQI